jgi:hypothetical protein
MWSRISSSSFFVILVDSDSDSGSDNGNDSNSYRIKNEVNSPQSIGPSLALQGA